MKTFKIFVLVLVIMFTAFFLVTTGEYYEHKLRENTILTNEAIERFEKDIKEGKNIDLDNYIPNNNKDYSNGMSNFNKSVSGTIDKVFSETLRYLFKSINDVVNE